MELVVRDKIVDTKKDIIPGELEFEDTTPATTEDFVKTMELDKNIIVAKSGDDDEK